VISIDALPDEALLVIFDHYMYGIRFKEESQKVEKTWQSLAHVCRRWRSIVFESPRRLDLRLVCTGGTPARDRLDVWPTLPLIIGVNFGDWIRNVDNIVAALECTDRVRQIDLGNVSSSTMEICLAAMQQQFPELTNLFLWSTDETVPVVLDSFLGGSAPRLEHVVLGGISFPGLPKLLLSATLLVTLQLFSIPHSGYFTPDAIAAAFSMLTSLDHLRLEFISTRSCLDRASRRPPPSTRSVLPVLTKFWFKGASKYMEDLAAHIDALQLNCLTITVFNDIVFDTPQLIQFIRRTPNLKAFEKADIELRYYAAMVKFSLQASPSRDERYLSLGILCKGLDRQLSYLRQVCTSCLPSLSTLEDLYFYKDPFSQLDGQDNTNNEPWVELLRPFSAVKNLYLAGKSASRVASVLQELVEGRTIEVLPMILPTLQNIFVRGLKSSGSVQEGIGQFVAARQLTGHPIAVSRWK
jgi:hypothetical protein